MSSRVGGDRPWRSCDTANLVCSMFARAKLDGGRGNDVKLLAIDVMMLAIAGRPFSDLGIRVAGLMDVKSIGS